MTTNILKYIKNPPRVVTRYSLLLVEISRNYLSTNVQIFGPVGLQYLPEFITEDGKTIITEDGNILVLG